MTRILCLAGSAREQSFHKTLARIAADKVDAAGAEGTFVDLRDFPMPLYDGDLESEDGVPPQAFELANLMVGHDGFLFACPEYNSSITPLLKNTIDWISRTGEGGPGLAVFEGRVVGLMATSPGGLGGIRGLVAVRSLLGNIGAIVCPTQLAIPKATNVFEGGMIQDARTDAKLTALVEEVVGLAARVAAR